MTAGEQDATTEAAITPSMDRSGSSVGSLQGRRLVERA
jgi:hypothetical protein